MSWGLCPAGAQGCTRGKQGEKKYPLQTQCFRRGSQVQGAPADLVGGEAGGEGGSQEKQDDRDKVASLLW